MEIRYYTSFLSNTLSLNKHQKSKKLYKKKPTEKDTSLLTKQYLNMEQFLNGAGSKAFDIALKSGVTYATSFAMKKMTRVIDDQLNKTITSVVTKATTKDTDTNSEGHLINNLKILRNRIDLKLKILTSALEALVDLSKTKGMSGNKQHKGATC